MAASRFSIQLLNDKAIMKKLNNLPKKLRNKGLRQAARAGGKVILQEVKATVPVLTGAYKRGIKLKALQRSRRYVGVRIATPTREELNIDPKDEFYYPAVLEYGSSKHVAGAHIRTAFEVKKHEAEQVFLNHLRASLPALVEQSA